MSTGPDASRRLERLRILGSGVAAALLLSVLASVLFPAPVRHQGRTVTQWLEQVDGPSLSSKVREAEAAFEAMGPRAVPDLEAILRERPRHFRVRFREAWHRSFANETPWLSHNELQARAIWALLKVATQADVDLAPLLPHVQYQLTNRLSILAALVLARAGPEGIGCLTNMLWTGSWALRDFAGFALSNDPKVRGLPEVRPALIQVTRAELDPQLRSRFLLYLSLFEPDGDSPVVVPLALEAVASPDGALRRSAVELLGRHRADPRAVPALRRAVDDPEPSVSAAARRLLGDGHAAPPAPR